MPDLNSELIICVRQQCRHQNELRQWFDSVGLKSVADQSENTYPLHDLFILSLLEPVLWFYATNLHSDFDFLITI